jgi:hypothetical protein
MRCLYSPLLMLLLPLAAAGQTTVGDDATAQYLLSQPSAQLAPAGAGVSVPLWLGPNGHLLALKADRENSADALHNSTLLSFHVVDASLVNSTGLQYGLAPNLQANAEVSQRTWVNQPTRVIGSELGATYTAGRYSLGLSVGANSTQDSSATLPRILPNAAAGVDGLSSFDNSAQVNARGRLALGNTSGIDMGASVGRIHLLPGNLLGVNTLDQKALSFGVDHGSLSGMLIGRTMEPQVGIAGGSLSPDRHWNSIDLGVTWRLPWRGQLSVGAQNLWSSGTPANTPAGPEPDQSRTPYVQYHQDL